MRTIPWRLATEYQNGTFNGTVPWERINEILNFESRYLTHQFVRVTTGHRITVLQSSRYLGDNVFAVYDAKSMTIKISPTANFQNNAYLLAKVILHERLHWKTSRHIESDPYPLMSPNGGTALNYTLADGWYFDGGYTWRGSLRPWHEPTKMYDVFGKGVRGALTHVFFNCPLCQGSNIMEYEKVDHPLFPNTPSHTVKLDCTNTEGILVYGNDISLDNSTSNIELAR